MMNGAAFWFGGSGRGGYPDVSKFHPAGSKLGGTYGKIEWGKVIPPNFTVQYASHMSYYETASHNLYFLNKLDWNKLTEIGDLNFTSENRFVYMGNNKRLILPELTKIGSNCFTGDTYFFKDILKEIEAPKLTLIGNNSFTSLRIPSYFQFYADELKQVGIRSFTNLRNFASDKYYGNNLIFPKLESIGSLSFRDLSPVNNIELISLKTIGNATFTQIMPANGSFGYGENTPSSVVDELKRRLPTISRWVERKPR